MRIIRPTKHEKLFNRFLQTIDWGFEQRYKWQNPLQVIDHLLYPDFRFVPSRLIIEVDGSIHWHLAADNDCKRDFWLEDCGYRVLHLSNREIETMTQEYLAKRIQEVYPTFPTPDEGMNRLFKQFSERNCEKSKKFHRRYTSDLSAAFTAGGCKESR